MEEVKHTYVVLAYKESKYLEDCIKSVLNQKYPSDVVIATSTPNKYIEKLANKYKLKIYVSKKSTGIGSDFDFATNCVKSDLITIAHQDDIYDYDYSYEVVKKYKKYKKSTILFTDYYEIKKGEKEYSNVNLLIKRILLLPLRLRIFSKFKFFKRSALRFGNAISCPAVTFVQKNVPKNKFDTDLTCNVDWYSWEKLSKVKGNFIFVSKKLMGHRISEETTTTKIINDGIRTKEDFVMFKKFWPTPIAKFFNKFYSKAEINNDLGEKKSSLFIQIIKFGLVGGLAFVIDYATLILCKEVFNLDVLLSAGIAFTVSVIFNYILSVKWVFDVDETKSKKKNFIIFIIFSIMGLGLTELIMWFGTDILDISYLIVKIIATAIVMVFNFVTRKLFLE